MPLGGSGLPWCWTCRVKPSKCWTDRCRAFPIPSLHHMVSREWSQVCLSWSEAWLYQTEAVGCFDLAVIFVSSLLRDERGLTSIATDLNNRHSSTIFGSKVPLGRIRYPVTVCIVLSVDFRLFLAFTTEAATIDEPNIMEKEERKKRRGNGPSP